MSDIDLLHLLHRFFCRLIQPDQCPAGQHHQYHKNQQDHRHLGSGGTKPVEQRQTEQSRNRSSSVSVHTVLEKREELFNQVAVGDARAEHLGRSAEQADEQHRLPYLVPDQTDGLVQCGMMET